MKLLEEAMLDHPKLFKATGSYLTVPKNTKHPILCARNRYLRCGIDGGRGSDDPSYWLRIAKTLDRPLSGQLDAFKLKAFIKEAQDGLRRAHEASLKAIASIAIVGHLHITGLKQKIGDRFHTHFVTYYTTDDLNSDYILPHDMRDAYEKL